MAPTAFAFPFASFTYEKWRGFHMEKPWERLVGGAVVLGRKASQNGGGHGLQRAACRATVQGWELLVWLCQKTTYDGKAAY